MSSEDKTSDAPPSKYESGIGAKKNLGPFFGKPKLTRVFLRDQDDSSDEEELEKKSSPIDYDEIFKKITPNKDKNFEFLWLVHILSNRLLYSKEVNTKYYTQKKPLLGSKLFSSEYKLRSLLEEIVLELVKDLAQYLSNITTHAVLSEDEINDLSGVALEEAEEQIQLILKNVRTYNTYNVNSAIKDLAKMVTDNLLTIKFNCFFDTTKFGYPPPQDYSELVERDSTLKIDYDSTHSQEALDQALKSIKPRLTGSGRMPKNQINNPLLKDTPSLAEQAWQLVKDISPSSSAKNKLDKHLNKLVPMLLLEQVSQDKTPERQDTNSSAWKKAMHSETNLWIVKCLALTDERMRELIRVRIRQLANTRVLSHFSSNRPTLGNKHDFISSNFLDFLANLRLAHRSIRREVKNVSHETLKSIYSGNSARTVQYHWSFFDEPNFSALETQTVSGGTSLKATLVDNMSTYANIYTQICNLIQKLNRCGKKCDEKTIVGLIRQALKGNISEAIKTFRIDDQELILDRITGLTYLLFGCEVARNPACLIIHQMMLDLILSDDPSHQTSFKALFTSSPPEMPMAAGGSVEIARITNMYFTGPPVKDGLVFPYKTDDSVQWSNNLNMQFLPLLTSEPALIKKWLGLKKIPLETDLNQIAVTICSCFGEWFGKNVFKKNQFLLSNCDDEGLSDDEQMSSTPGGVLHTPPQDRPLPTLVFNVSNFIPVEPLTQLIQQKIDEKFNGHAPQARFLQIKHIGKFNKVISSLPLLKNDKDESEDGSENKATTEGFVIEKLATLATGQTLLIPINHNDLHFTLLAFRRTANEGLKAVYVDSFGDFNNGSASIKIFCETIDDAIALETYCVKYQANSDCAIHTEANAEILLHLSDDKFSAEGLKEEILRQELNKPQIATQRRLNFALRAQVLPGIEQIYSAVVIDTALLEQGKKSGLMPK